MIGLVPAAYQPTSSGNSFATNQINYSGALENQVDGKLIKVQNNPIDDFRVIAKEFSLAAAVRQNEDLRGASSIDAQKSPKDRIFSLGYTLTAKYNWGNDGNAKKMASKICEESPRNTSVDIKSDPAILERGSGFILSLIDNEHPIDTTTYAFGLNIGHNMKQGKLDPFILEHFAALWELSMKKPQKNDAEETVESGSVQKLREIFEPRKNRGLEESRLISQLKLVDQAAHS